MTAVALTQPTARFRTARFRTVRALRLEIKHSTAVWVLPVLAVLFYVNAYRTAAGYPPTWTVRASVITGSNLVFFSVIAAGIAAWVATREGRRKTGDLLATTARAAWARQATVLAATAFWTVLAYLAGVAVIYVQTALQATWGGPPLWPVAVGVAGVAVSCAVGFTCGTLLPGRFTAPIVAVAVFAAWFVGVAATNSVNPGNVSSLSNLKGTPALLVTATGRPAFIDAGVYYHIPPDVSIAQIMFMAGVLLVMVGLLALPPAARVPGVRGPSFAGRRWLTVAAAVGVACGFEHGQSSFGDDVHGVHRFVKRHTNMALGREVVDFRRTSFLNYAYEIRRVGHVAVVQRETHVVVVLVLIEMINPIGIERGGSAFDAVYGVALTKEQFSKIGAVLTGDAADQRHAFAHGDRSQSLNLVITYHGRSAEKNSRKDEEASGDEL